MATINFNTQLPGYDVLAELGRGNTRVLKARHIATGDVVAIKQYAFAADADTLRRFERESQIMTQIDHPNVVRVREVQLTAAMPYVVMDYVEGGDLRGLLRQHGHLPIPTLIRIGLQLTQAFRAVHPLRVVHRDIKPENILYRTLASGELHFLLTDFGIAKVWSDDNARTRTGHSLMTCEYASPEQFDNPRQVDAATDYYALGVVLYESLTGHVPFPLTNETGLAQFMQQVLTAPLPPPVIPTGEPIPPSLEALILRLLARNPQERLCRTEELELLLEQSRVEHLKANWVAPTTTPSGRSGQTLAGPVAAATPYAQPTADELIDDDDVVAETPGNNWLWWSLGGTAVAAALAFGLYTYATRSDATTLSTAPDSTTTTAIDSTQLYAEPEQSASTTLSDTTAEMDPAETMPAEPATPPPVMDTTQRNVVPADSTVPNLLPDSTGQ